MLIDKDQMIQLLKDKGNTEQADQAQGQRPDTVDTDQHSDLLAKLGIDSSDLSSIQGIAGKPG